MNLVPLILLSPDLLLIAAAVIPALVLLVFVYRQDSLEKESPKLLFKLVAFGAASTALAEAAETAGIAILPYVSAPGSTKYYFLLFFFVVGLAEEGFKYLLMRACTWRSSEFNCLFDGVVFAVFTSLGFALWENISYVISYGLSTAIARALTAVPGHACFGVFMGSFYGAAKRCEMKGDASGSLKNRILAVVIPMLLHGAYDFIASDDIVPTFIFIIFIALMFVSAYRRVKKISAKDEYIA